MRYVALFVAGLILLGIQTLISNLFFLGKLVFEISLVLVIYGGFNFTWGKGGVFCALLGLFLDYLMGSVSGLYAFLYLLLFLLSKFLSLRMYAEKYSFIVIFIGLGSFLESLLAVSFYKLAFNVDKFSHLWNVFVPQAFIVALPAPLFFSLFRKIEGFFYGGESRSLERAAIR